MDLGQYLLRYYWMFTEDKTYLRSVEKGSWGCSAVLLLFI